MKSADARNVIAASSKVYLRTEGVSMPVICKTVRLRAASVPGYDALMIGLINFSSKSSITVSSSVSCPIVNLFNFKFFYSLQVHIFAFKQLSIPIRACGISLVMTFPQKSETDVATVVLAGWAKCYFNHLGWET